MNEVVQERERRIQSRGKTGQVKFGPRVQNIIQSSMLIYLSMINGFPNTPWLSLSDKDRGIFLKMINGLPHIIRYALTWNNPPLTFALNEPDAMTLDMWRKQCRERLPSIPESDPIKSGFFSVNLKYGRRVLIEEFAKYLTHFEGKAMSECPSIEKEMIATKKTPGRKGNYDALNALAAMRLRYYCDTFSAAKELMQLLKNKPHGMFYERRHSFNRACRSAVAHFEQLYGWLDTAKPKHFTTGWGLGAQK